MNALYENGRQAFLEGRIAWLTDTIRAALVDTSAGKYICDLEIDGTLDAIPKEAVIAVSEPFKGKTAYAGVANAPRVRFKAVTGPMCGALVLFKDGGAAGESPLIAYLDTGPGIPVIPAGGDVLIEWDDRPIFRI